MLFKYDEYGMHESIQIRLIRGRMSFSCIHSLGQKMLSRLGPCTVLVLVLVRTVIKN